MYLDAREASVTIAAMRRSSIAVVVLVVLGLAAGGFLWWRQSLPLPTAAWESSPPPLGRTSRTYLVKLAAPAGKLKGVRAQLDQGGKRLLEATENLEPRGLAETNWELHLDVVANHLAEGPAQVTIFVEDDQWRPRKNEAPALVGEIHVDITPPVLELRASTGYIKHAGTGVAVYRVRDATSSGVRVGEAEFTGTAGIGPDPDVRVALFTIPYDADPVPPTLFARDDADNARTAPIPVVFLPVTFSKDEVKLSDSFLQSKVPELDPSADASSLDALLAAFLKINRDVRKANEARIREIGRSADQAAPLWSGAFVQQPNTQVFASFPQKREYTRNGKSVDAQWHLGLDLASNATSPVLASNAGKVLFAGDNGIYGNMVVLDHGLSLCSLYAHMSSISVGVGQSVSKGEALGVSGRTGLAAGDHLHFAMLVHGIYTNPPDWFDPGYIHDRIALPLQEAGIALPGITDLAAPSRAVKPKKQPLPPRKTSRHH
jgi:murein DD-endopeptidase MepM/ murein hydrolase activator NlpD